MPKVSKQVQRRIAELDAQYTVAQPKRPGGALRKERTRAYHSRSHCRGRILYTPIDHVRLVQLTLKQGPAPAMLGAASTGFKSGE